MAMRANFPASESEVFAPLPDNRGRLDQQGLLLLSGIIILILLLSTASCTTRYQAQPTDRVSVLDNYALLETEGVAFAITPRLWTREPQRVSDFFTTFHIIVKNQTDKPLVINAEDLVLLDEERNQYDALDIPDVSHIVFYDDFLSDKFSPLPERGDTFSGERMTGRANLLQEAFHYGDIRPGARKSGFIFFRRLPGGNRIITILFKDEEIVFVRG
jgi:hypothetical protein